jgi:hypothetical protein
MTKKAGISSVALRRGESSKQKIVAVRNTSQNFKSNGEILRVYDIAIESFLKLIPEPEWIEWKKQRGELFIKPLDEFPNPPPHSYKGGYFMVLSILAVGLFESLFRDEGCNYRSPSAERVC